MGSPKLLLYPVLSLRWPSISSWWPLAVFLTGSWLVSKLPAALLLPELAQHLRQPAKKRRGAGGEPATPKRTGTH